MATVAAQTTTPRQLGGVFGFYVLRLPALRAVPVGAKIRAASQQEVGAMMTWHILVTNPVVCALMDGIAALVLAAIALSVCEWVRRRRGAERSEPDIEGGAGDW